MALLIFTDLDGTLLNADDYRYESAIPVIETLKTKHIPVIAVTSKTRQEVETLRQSLNLSDPFIVENGSAIFIPSDSPQFVIPAPLEEDGYHIEQIGCSYAQARQGLKTIAKILGQDLCGFGDLTEAEIETLTGLSPEAVQQAKAREFSEPFLTPADIPLAYLGEIAKEQGFRLLVGDRFSHLISPKAGKGKAVQWLSKHYQLGTSDDKLVTIGLGNSPNDLEMLEQVDVPVIVPGFKGVHPELIGRGWQVAPKPGSSGWAMAVTEICTAYSKLID